MLSALHCGNVLWRSAARESGRLCPLRVTVASGDNWMRILMFFRWAKKRITVRLEIRFLA
jgi:hypothetical protein